MGKISFLCFITMSLTMLSSLFAQQETYGFILTKEKQTIDGQIFFNNETPGLVSVKDATGRLRTFTADQVTEINDTQGYKYVSKSIVFNDIKQNVFLLLVVSGRVNLLYLKGHEDRFFLETNQLIEITKENYSKTILDNYPACNRKWKRQITNLRFRMLDLSFAVMAINNENCVNIPMHQLGYAYSYGNSDLTMTLKAFPKSSVTHMIMGDVSKKYGVFYEMPLWSKTRIDLMISAEYSGFEYDFKTANSYKMQEFWLNASGVNVSVTPIYNFNTNIIVPYIFLGPEVFINLNSGSKLRETILGNSGAQINEEGDFLDIPKLFYGGNVGGGIKYYYVRSRFIAMEFNKPYIFSYDGYYFNTWYIKLKASIIRF